jgi:hypothetical protein
MSSVFTVTVTGVVVYGNSSSLMPPDGEPSLPEYGISGGFSLNLVQNNGMDTAGEITVLSHIVIDDDVTILAGTQIVDSDTAGATAVLLQKCKPNKLLQT